MPRWNGPGRYGGPWYGNDVHRVLFERGAKHHFPTLQGMTQRSGRSSGRRYRVAMEIPHYEPRQVEVFFPKDAPKYVEITVDGPTDSPHRYDAKRLCIWHPDDPVENRWVFDDGLLSLLGLVAAHLFREAWWRETREWLGPAVDHPAQPCEEEANTA